MESTIYTRVLRCSWVSGYSGAGWARGPLRHAHRTLLVVSSFLSARLSYTGHILQKNATEDSMTAATIVICACCERARWLEVSTGSNGTLDEAIWLARFGVSACGLLSRSLHLDLGNYESLVRGRAVPVRSLG